MQSEKVGKGEIINIGSGKNYSVNQIADFLDGERIYVDPVIEPKESLALNAKASKLLGWEPEQDLEQWI